MATRTVSSPTLAGLKKFKVCHLVSGDLWAGAEVQVATFIPHLIKDAEFDIYAVILNEGRLARELRECGAFVTVYQESRSNSLAIIKKLIDFFKENKIDILHTHRYKENILGSLAGRLSGVPHIVSSVHGMTEPFSLLKQLKMTLYHYLNYLALRFLTDRVIAVSSDLRTALSKTYGSQRVVCIHNAIDLSKMNISSHLKEKRQELKIPCNHRIIGTIGRLVPIKGIDYFLHAAQLILEKRSDICFVVVGDGPERHYLEQLSRTLQIERNVRFTGYSSAIYDLLNIMDVFVLASLHEGIPTALLEALAMGKPVVGTKVGGIPEVIQGNGLGTLVAPRNSTQIADACLSLLKCSTVGTTAGGYQYIASEFSVEASGWQLIALYKNLACQQ